MGVGGAQAGRGAEARGSNGVSGAGGDGLGDGRAGNAGPEQGAAGGDSEDRCRHDVLYAPFSGRGKAKKEKKKYGGEASSKAQLSLVQVGAAKFDLVERKAWVLVAIAAGGAAARSATGGRAAA